MHPDRIRCVEKHGCEIIRPKGGKPFCKPVLEGGELGGCPLANITKAEAIEQSGESGVLTESKSSSQV